MPVKFFCDVCNKEMKTTEMGSFSWVEKAIKLIFVKHQSKDESQLVEKKYILCVDCIKKIREAIKI